MPRRAALSPDVIARKALDVGDREGPKAMTMRRIAAALDCDPMALYRHFPDRQALLDAVADLALADVPDPQPRQPWEARVLAVLTGIRAAALRHRGIAGHVAARPPLQRNGQRLAAAIVQALTDSGLPPADVVRAAQALVAYLAAALAMSVQAGAPDARWHQLRATIAALPAPAPDAALPADALPVTGSADQFDYGIRLLISGIRAEAQASHAGTVG
ncbi:TetR/AcrR family transcriptional regulator [Micromonospora sp. NBC_01813]|uniref:TetR/AcrR family transcriptional regulator n=1 Tax=Micromonospora sp. NBC_01813 TaxID=2975988 RepID=UPI002DDC71E6|nr:TetR/AcrR family transcriptional regulator C-terminal domain-containing protein [Micromonospora sp. NBC_01813]WSA09503.1 TetR/AcrR family transcriptional regulator [Micromonospora sp. NBC_01813]